MRDFALLRDIASLLTDDPSFRFRVVAMPKHRAGFQFSPNVEFLWDLSDEEMRAEFQSADVLLLPLLGATANNALNEAMACGLPVVASDLPALREYAGDEAAAWVRGNNRDAYLGILRALASDPERRRRMGLAARTRAEAVAWPAVARRMAEFYKTLEGR